MHTASQRCIDVSQAALAHTLITPGGIPARSHSSAMIMVAPGSRSEGLTTRVLPVTVARAADHSTILSVSCAHQHQRGACLT